MRPTSLFSAVCTLVALVPACDLNAPAAPEPTTTRASAVTAAAPAGLPPRSAWNDIGPRPGTPPPRQIPRPADVSASQYPGHFRNKVVEKAAPATTSAVPPSVPGEYVVKQQEYVKQLGKLEPAIANLPPEEQSARRADLKRSVLGD